MRLHDRLIAMACVGAWLLSPVGPLLGGVVGASPLSETSQPPTVGIVELEKQALEARDARMACGPLSLWYCLRRSGLDRQPNDVLNSFADRGDGVSLRELSIEARRHGLRPRVVQMSRDSLAALSPPAILVIDDSHCVVFDGIVSDTEARIFEPTSGTVGPEPLANLSLRWTGQAITFRKPAPTVVGALSLGVAIGMIGTGVVVLVLPTRVRAPWRACRWIRG